MTKSKNEIAAEIFQALHGNMYFPQHKGLVDDEWQQFKDRGIGIIEDILPEFKEEKETITPTDYDKLTEEIIAKEKIAIDRVIESFGWNEVLDFLDNEEKKELMVLYKEANISYGQ